MNIRYYIGRFRFRALNSAKRFIRNPKLFNILLRIRTKFRLLIWRAEYIFFHAVRRKKKFFVINIGESRSGFMACFMKVLGGIAYADRHAMIPVVDMKNYQNAYLYPDEVGRINAWEYYFEQPGGVSLDEALAAPGTVSANTTYYPSPRLDNALFMNLDGQLDYWRKICRKYIRVTPSVKESKNTDWGGGVWGYLCAGLTI